MAPLLFFELMLPREGPSETAGCADLVLVAPSAAECRVRGRLTDTLETIATNVRQGGMAYVLVPPRWRRSVEHRLRGIEGARLQPYAHLPRAASPGFVVPLVEEPLRYAFRHAASLPGWARRLAASFAGLPLARRALARWAPSVGFVVFPAHSEPFEWLAREAPDEARPLHVVARMSWRGSESPLVLHGFEGQGGAQVLVAKAANDAASSAAAEREAENLRMLHAGAIAAGAHLPTLLASDRIGRSRVIIETPVTGEPAALLLASRPQQAPEVMDRIACWLLRWHEATRTDHPLSADHLARWFEEPLRCLSPDLPDVRAISARRQGDSVPLVAAHLDLTMSNVFLDDTEALGIVDWEEAEPRALPLVDYFYAVTDVALAAHGGTRLDAFRACFSRDGRHAERVRGHVDAFAEALGLDPDLVWLCFDACWLHHARNEAERATPGQDRPFLEILRWRVAHGEQLQLMGER